jgi:hypothetical protein
MNGMGYTAAQVEEIAGKLRSLPAIEPPPKDLTKQEVVRMLAKEIKSLQKRGYSLEQIASSLKGEGLDISTPTLKSYLQRTKTTTKPKAALPDRKKLGSTSSPSTAKKDSLSDEKIVDSSDGKVDRSLDEKVESLSDERKKSGKSKLTPRPDSEL